jgi:acetyl-CoA acetyltransferase
MTRAPVYVVDGARTPFLKSKNRPGPFAAGDLAVQAGRALLVRQKFAPQDQLDEVILGCAAPVAGRSQYRSCGCRYAWAAAHQVPGMDGDAKLRERHAGD